jgi:hypothetical protein
MSCHVTQIYLPVLCSPSLPLAGASCTARCKGSRHACVSVSMHECVAPSGCCDGDGSIVYMGGEGGRGEPLRESAMPRRAAISKKKKRCIVPGIINMNDYYDTISRDSDDIDTCIVTLAPPATSHVHRLYSLPAKPVVYPAVLNSRQPGF